jgi:S1-C subfamily serine protease
MPGTEFTCPKCGSTARSARDIATGALVKCPRCSHVFRFGETPIATAQPVRQDDDTDDDRPRRRRDETRIRDRREDDDYYDDRPRRRRYDDDDDDRPRRKKGWRVGSGLVFGIVFFVMLVGVAGGVLAYIWKSTGTNEVVLRNPAPPPRGGGPGGVFGEFNFGEPFDVAGLNNAADDGPDEKAKLTQSAAKLLSDPSLTPDRPRRLVGPAPAGAKESIEGEKAVTSLAPDVLKKVKNATTFILCKFNDGRAGSGSGFVVGPNLVMTNAHVVGMLPPGSRPPQGLDVILNSGMDNEAKCTGKVLDVDHEHDLALVRVSKPDKDVKLPEPLMIATAASLRETQPVWVFGYPLGERLGKAVTVSPTAVSSFRRESQGMRVQVNGGMDHGNSGGPVVDSAGQVIGVSVAKIEQSQFHFAVAAEHVSELLQGHLATLAAGRLTRKGDGYELPITVAAHDPMKKIKGVAIEWWWGEPGQKVPATREKPPEGGPARQKVTLKAGGDGKFTGSITVGAKPPEGKILWLQASHAGSAASDVAYYEGLAVEPVGAVEARSIQLAYKPRKAAGKLAVRSSDTIRFATNDGGVHTAEVNVAGLMNEERLGQGQQGAWVFRDSFTSMDDQMTFDGHGMDRTMGIATNYKPHASKSKVELQYDGSGKVTAGRPAFGDDVPEDSRRILSAYVGKVARAIELTSLGLPEGEIAPGHTWNDQRRFPLTGPESEANINAQLKLKYTYTGIRKLDGREVAEISVSGEADDPTADDDKPGKINGYVLIDMKTGEVSKANVVLEANQKGRNFHGEMADVTHTLEVKLQRE